MGKKGNGWKYQSNSIVSYDYFFMSSINETTADTPRPISKTPESAPFYLPCLWSQGFRNSPKSFVCNLPPVMWISNCSQKAMVFSDVLRSWDGMIIKSAERKKDREKECEQSKGLIKCHYPSGSNPSRRPWTCGLSQTAQGSLTHVAPLRARRPIHLSNRYSTRVRRGATPLFIPYLSLALFVQSSLSSPRFHPRPLSRR